MEGKEKEMAIEEGYLKNFIASVRPAEAEIRKKLDFGYSWDGKSTLLFTIRPSWLNPQETMQSDFAKITYVKSTKIWKLYWMRGSGKWEMYEPFPTANNLQKLLGIIKDDEHGCFFG